MRTIKFRIWDKQFNKFLYQLPEKHHLDWERFDVQQFTGLTDKLGKEIYEGDVIYIAGYGYYIVRSSFMELYETMAERDIGEIKGNLYENPKLLK